MKMTSNAKRLANKGFTLIELIAAIAIIGIISAIAVNRYSAVVFDAKAAKAATVIGIVEKAKDMLVSNDSTTTAALDAYNSATDANKLATLYPLMRINGQQPGNVATLVQGTGYTNLIPGTIAVPAHVISGGTSVAAVAGTPATLQ